MNGLKDLSKLALEKQIKIKSELLAASSAVCLTAQGFNHAVKFCSNEDIVKSLVSLQEHLKMATEAVVALNDGKPLVEKSEDS